MLGAFGNYITDSSTLWGNYYHPNFTDQGIGLRVVE